MSTLQGGAGGIVTDGLVLHLDAANYKSYTSGSTIWRDLTINNYNGTLTNNPTMSFDNAGCIIFDGVDDHVVIPTTINSSYTGFTTEIFFKSSDAGNSGNAYLIYDHSAGYPIWLGKSQGNEWYWFWNFAGARGKSARLSSTSYIANTWIHIGVRGYLSNTNTISETGNFAELIVNGISYSTAHRNDNDISPSFPLTSIYLAKKGTAAGNGELGVTVSNYSNITIGSFRLYNKVLSRTQILQNYNSVKKRFGL